MSSDSRDAGEGLGPLLVFWLWAAVTASGLVIMLTVVIGAL